MSTFILGGGITGLAAGSKSGHTVFEAEAQPGGICSSYYMRPGSDKRLPTPPEDGEAYRFEVGGGHWIFGSNPDIEKLIKSLVPVRRYERKSSIFFPEQKLQVPYPIQYHLRFLEADIADSALAEMQNYDQGADIVTMQDWLLRSFGETLNDLFFEPFHKLYTAGLYTQISPQDSYKSPVDVEIARLGATGSSPSVGYNTSYLYPENGLDSLARKLAEGCDIRYESCVSKIDTDAKVLYFKNNDSVAYDKLISTLPLSRTLELCGIELQQPANPHTSVLVLNIGAEKTSLCPDDHWIYLPGSQSGFHRVGFYSNVDPSFLPKSTRTSESRVSIYVERAYQGEEQPDTDSISRYARDVVEELQNWGFIGAVEAIDPTWIDVGYTWALPGSTWQEQAINALSEHDIDSVGRYARWKFQGISDSIQEGLEAGLRYRK